MEKNYLTCADTAKLLRTALKNAFPGVKFSVRSDTYSGGASIRVRWTDGPFTKDVDAIAQRYAGATFDGSIDLKEYHTDLVHFEGEEMPRLVRFGSDFVFTDRDISPDYEALLTVEAQKIIDSNRTTAGRVFDPKGNNTDSGNDYLASEWGVITSPWGYGPSVIRFLSHHIPAPSKVKA